MKKQILFVITSALLLLPLTEIKAQQPNLQQAVRNQNSNQPRTIFQNCGPSRFEISCGSYSGEVALRVTGTDANDWIQIQCSGQSTNASCLFGAVAINMDHFCPQATKVVIYGGRGDDRLDASGACRGVSAEIYGEAGNDKIRGTNGDDIIQGGGGNDDIFGLDGDDVIDGGAGNDKIDGGVGNDDIQGGAGNDEIFADPSDWLTGQPPWDFSIDPYAPPVALNHDLDVVHGGVGNDCIVGLMSFDSLNGDGGNDDISGSGQLEGGEGSDRLYLSYCPPSPASGDGGYVYDNARVVVVVNGNGGLDRLLKNPHCYEQLNGGAQSDNLASFVEGGENYFIRPQPGEASDFYVINGGLTYSDISPNYVHCSGESCRASYYQPRACIPPVW